MTLRFVVAFPPEQRLRSKRSSVSVTVLTLCVEIHFNNSGPFAIRLVIFTDLRAHGLPNNFYRVTRMHIGYWWACQKERDHCEDQDIGGWTILKWILER
jgi:hypothetical protein